MRSLFTKFVLLIGAYHVSKFRIINLSKQKMQYVVMCFETVLNHNAQRKQGIKDPVYLKQNQSMIFEQNPVETKFILSSLQHFKTTHQSNHLGESALALYHL